MLVCQPINLSMRANLQRANLYLHTPCICRHTCVYTHQDIFASTTYICAEHMYCGMCYIFADTPHIHTCKHIFADTPHIHTCKHIFADTPHIHTCKHLFTHTTYVQKYVDLHTPHHTYSYILCLRTPNIYMRANMHANVGTRCRRHIGCLMLQVNFRKRATNYRALLRKMTYKDKAFCGSSPPCMIQVVHRFVNICWHCNNLQYTTTCRNALQYTATQYDTSGSSLCQHLLALQHPTTCCNTLQHTATQYDTSGSWLCIRFLYVRHCNTLRQTATHCNILQCTAMHCNTPWHRCFIALHTFFICKTLQHTATHRTTLQHIAMHCNTLHCPATHCNALQHSAMHCNTLRCTAMHCNALQLTATHCSTLQHTMLQVVHRFANLLWHCNTLQHTATHYATGRSSFCQHQSGTHCHSISQMRCALQCVAA